MKCSVSWCHVSEGLMRRKTTSPLYKKFGQQELCPTHVPPWRAEEYESVDAPAVRVEFDSHGAAERVKAKREARKNGETCKVCGVEKDLAWKRPAGKRISEAFFCDGHVSDEQALWYEPLTHVAAVRREQLKTQGPTAEAALVPAKPAEPEPKPARKRKAKEEVPF